MTFLFFANLGDSNAGELAKETGPREAVLLSTPGAAKRTLDAARAVKSKGLPLAADNANTAVILSIAREFVDRAAELYGERLAAASGDVNLYRAPHPAAITRRASSEASLERGLEAADLFRVRLSGMGIDPEADLDPLPFSGLAGEPWEKPLPAELRAKYRALARDLAARCRQAATDDRQRDVLSTQASVDPDFFTCLEDLTAPILVQLEIDPQAIGLRRAEIIGWQDRGLALAGGVMASRYGAFQGVPYATLHAFDYDSAFQVGARAAAISGLQGVATGLASFLLDRSYVNSFVLKGRRVWVDGRRNVPRRYLRLLLVTMGLLDGFASERGALPRFHGLGAGAPIALPLLALAGYGSPLLSLDSTAPEKNASIGKLFVNEPAPLTVSVDKVAQALIDDRQSWNCPCPACAAIQAQLPFDLPAARRFYAERIAPRPIEDADLEDDQGVGQHLSLLWSSKVQPQKKQILQARVGHSQWAMAGITRALREHSTSYPSLREWVGRVCAAYQATTTPTFALQIDECLRLIDRLRR